jgi:hypothetical protein
MKLHKATRYKVLSPKWQKYKDLYEGDHDVIVNNPAYLIPHTLELKGTVESNKLYKNRKDRTKWLKIVEMIVSIWCSTLYKEPPSFDDAASALLERLNADKDIDGEQTSFKSFITDQLTPNYMVYGDVAVLSESFNLNAQSRAEELELGARPYLKLITPLQLTDWAKETANPARLGKFNFARYEYYKEQPRDSEEQEIKRLLCSDSYRRDAQGRISIQKYTAELDQQGKPKMVDGEIDWTKGDLVLLNEKLTEIPLRILQKETWVDGVCEEALRYFNHRSNLDSHNHFQGYPSVYMFGVDPADGGQYNLIAEYILTMIKDPDARVERLSAGESAGMERAVEDSFNTTMKVGLDRWRSLPANSKAVQGAETISEENRPLYTLLLSTIDTLETFVQHSLNDLALLAGEDKFEGKVIFNREIVDDDINQLIKVFNSFKDLLMPIDGVQSAMAEKIIPKLKLSDEKTKELLEKIQSLVIEPAQDENDPVNRVISGQAN